MKNLAGIFIFIFFSTGFPSAYGKCGKLVNALLSYDSKTAKAGFENFYFTQEEFCDGGLAELNANLEVHLVGKNKKILASKNIFISSFTVVESLGKKDSAKIEKNVIEQVPQYRNVKFSLTVPASQVARYNIYQISDKKLLGSGEVK